MCSGFLLHHVCEMELKVEHMEYVLLSLVCFHRSQRLAALILVGQIDLCIFFDNFRHIIYFIWIYKIEDMDFQSLIN